MNQIYQITNKEIEKIKMDCLETYIVDIDGGKILNLSQFLDIMTEKFKFPIPSKSLDSYLDWIRDLSWIDAQEFVLIIRNFKLFLKNEPERKKTVLETFREYILPWWETEVEQCVVGGKAKPFNIYLID